MSRGYRRFLLLWAASLVATVGSGMTSFGLGVYAFEKTGLASVTGWILLAGFLPGLLMSPLAGVLADRLDRRWLMMIGDGCSIIGLVMIYFALKFGFGIPWILVGIVVSSSFSALTEPAFNSTVSDLLEPEEYTRASGMVQLTSAARFLVSPLLAGILLQIWDMSVLLLIDMSTILLTVTAAYVVRRELGLPSRTAPRTTYWEDLREGYRVLRSNQGLWKLVLAASGVSLFFGIAQMLSTPMILSFADSEFLGMTLSISSCGILTTSLILGMVPIRNHFHRILSLSLFFAGLFMAFFGLREQKAMIIVFGFMMFSMLPLCNMSIDYLARTNMPDDVQGRVWGLIGILSQLGYVFAYAVIGQLADRLFVPLLLPGGVLSGTIGRIIGAGAGRGFGLLMILSGLLLSVSALMIWRSEPIRKMEKPCIPN